MRDPSLVRDNRINVRFDDLEIGLLQGISNYTGVPLAAVIRQLALQQAEEDLGLVPNPKAPTPQIEDAHQHP